MPSYFEIKIPCTNMLSYYENQNALVFWESKCLLERRTDYSMDSANTPWTTHKRIMHRSGHYVRSSDQKDLLMLLVWIIKAGATGWCMHGWYRLVSGDVVILILFTPSWESSFFQENITVRTWAGIAIVLPSHDIQVTWLVCFSIIIIFSYNRNERNRSDIYSSLNLWRFIFSCNKNQHILL